MSQPAIIVERSRAFETEIRAALAVWGIEAEAVTPEELPLRVQEVAPSLIFLEVEEPDRLGFALCAQIRSTSRAVPVVLSSATMSRADLELHQKLKVHADAYLLKPEMDRSQLARTVHRLIGADTPSDRASAFGQPTEPASTRPAPDAHRAESTRASTWRALQDAQEEVDRQRAGRGRAVRRAWQERRRRRALAEGLRNAQAAQTREQNRNHAALKRLSVQLSREVSRAAERDEQIAGLGAELEAANRERHTSEVARATLQTESDRRKAELGREVARRRSAESSLETLASTLERARRTLASAESMLAFHDRFARWLASEQQTQATILELLDGQKSWSKHCEEQLARLETGARQREAEHVARLAQVSRVHAEQLASRDVEIERLRSLVADYHRRLHSRGRDRLHVVTTDAQPRNGDDEDIPTTFDDDDHCGLIRTS